MLWRGCSTSKAWARWCVSWMSTPTGGKWSAPLWCSGALLPSLLCSSEGSSWGRLKTYSLSSLMDLWTKCSRMLELSGFEISPLIYPTLLSMCRSWFSWINSNMVCICCWFLYMYFVRSFSVLLFFLLFEAISKFLVHPY